MKGVVDHLLYHTEPGPVSIDLLRKFLADGFRPVAWPYAGKGSYVFVLDFAREAR